MITLNVVGRLGADAEVKNSEKGRLVTLRLATDDFIDGQKATVWFSVAVKADTLGNIVPYLTKGKMVQVIGKERVRLYKDRNGETKIARDIFAHHVEFIGSASGTTKSETSEVVNTATNTVTSIPTPQHANDTSDIEAAMSCGTFQPSYQHTPSPAMSMATSHDTDVDELPF